MSLSKSKRNKGFSLIELMVSVAIFVIITSLILTRHSQFSGNILVENLAYDIALSIRKAQIFGLSVIESGTSGFDVGYGVHFDNTDMTKYYFFIDKNRDGRYKSADGDSIIETFTLTRGNVISQFCVNTSLKCSPDDISSLDIVFNRPNPDAIITVDEDTGTSYSLADITILSPQGAQWTISTGNTGQISVQK